MTEFRVGDEVFGIAGSSNAQYVAVRETGVIAQKPTGLTYEQAAAGWPVGEPAYSRRTCRGAAGDSDRRVWHRAAVIHSVHEHIAYELEEAAILARRRGALGVAVTALRRSAELSGPDHRAGRLLASAEIALELGQWEAVEHCELYNT